MTIELELSIEERESALLSALDKLNADKAARTQQIEAMRLRQQARERAAQAEAAKQRERDYAAFVAGVESRFSEIDREARELRKEIDGLLSQLNAAVNLQHRLCQRLADTGLAVVKATSETFPEHSSDVAIIVHEQIRKAEVVKMPSPRARMDFHYDAEAILRTIGENARRAGLAPNAKRLDGTPEGGRLPEHARNPTTQLAHVQSPIGSGVADILRRQTSQQTMQPVDDTENAKETPTAHSDTNISAEAPQQPAGASVEAISAPSTDAVEVTLQPAQQSARPVTLSVKAWIDAFTVPDADGVGTKATTLFDAYYDAATQSGDVNPVSEAAFYKQLRKLGYIGVKRHNGSHYPLKLKA